MLHIEKKQDLLNSWEFEALSHYYKEIVMMDYSLFPEYCQYLADIGRIDILLDLIDNQLNVNSLLLDSVQKLPDYNVISELEICLQKYRIANRGAGFFFDLFHLSINNQYKDLVTMLERGWEENIKAEISAENNMILNFAMNKLIDSRFITYPMLINLINHIYLPRNINDICKKSFISLIIKAVFGSYEIKKEFFKLSVVHNDSIRKYNHLQALVAIISAYTDTDIGAKLGMSQIYTMIRKHNNLQLRKKDQLRIAVCISGLYKNSDESLESIFSNLVNPLGADVFMHTWDRQQNWPGKTALFWGRTMTIKEELIPERLLDLNFLQENYPKIADALFTSHYSIFDKYKIENKFSFKQMVIENEQQFLKDFSAVENLDEDSNQSKMFYGIYKCFSLLKNYEQQQGFQYDYIIRVRPDLFVGRELCEKDFERLGSREIVIPTARPICLADTFFYGHRDCMIEVGDIFRQMIERNSFSIFPAFPKYNSHRLLLAYFLAKDIKPVKCRVPNNITGNTMKLKIPNLKDALQQEGNNEELLQKYPKETKWLYDNLIDRAL